MHLAHTTLTIIRRRSAGATLDAGDLADTQRGVMAFSVVRFLLLAAAIGSAWAFGAVDPWASISLGIVAVLALLSWAIGSVQQRVLKLVWSPMYLPLVLFFVYGLIQCRAHLAIDRWETRTALTLLAPSLLFFFLAGQVFGNASAETRHRFGIAVVLFTGILGLFAILQSASGTEKIYWTFDTQGSFFGPYRNPDHFAGLMEMLIPLCAFYVATQRKISAALALPILIVIIAISAQLLCGSRAGLLALLAEIVISAVMSVGLVRATHRGERGPLMAITTTVIAVVVIAAALLFSWLDSGAATQRLGSVTTPGSAWESWSGFRKSVALDSLRMLRDHPLFGIGLGNFEAVYPQYQTLPTDLTVDYAHNDFVEVISETGVIGAALILWALAVFVRAAFRNAGERLREESMLDGSWIQLGAAVGCCGLLVHSFFDFNLHIPANATWFAVLAAMATTSFAEEPQSAEEALAVDGGLN